MKFVIEQSGVSGNLWLIRSGTRGAVWGKAKERARIFVDRARAEALAKKLVAGSEIALSVVELDLGETEMVVPNLNV
jgi:hypothetical protein